MARLMTLDGRALSWESLHAARRAWYERPPPPTYCSYETCRRMPVAGWDRCDRHRYSKRPNGRAARAAP